MLANIGERDIQPWSKGRAAAGNGLQMLTLQTISRCGPPLVPRRTFWLFTLLHEKWPYNVNKQVPAFSTCKVLPICYIMIPGSAGGRIFPKMEFCGLKYAFGML